MIIDYARVRSILCLSGMKHSLNGDYEYSHSGYKQEQKISYRPPSVSREFVSDPELFAVFISCPDVLRDSQAELSLPQDCNAAWWS